MSNTDNMRIEFDGISNEYYAFWSPPAAIGSGKTELDALRDLQEVVHFSVDTLLESRREGMQNLDRDKGNTGVEDQEEIRVKARKIVSLLPKQNCGKCGFNNCGELAMAVAQGKASPYSCHEGTSLGKRISEIAGIDMPEKKEIYDLNIGFPHFRIFRKGHHYIDGRMDRHLHRSHFSKHRHGRGSD